MASPDLFQSTSLIELVIFGFIAFNMLLAASDLARRGLQRLTAGRGD